MSGLFSWQGDGKPPVKSVTRRNIGFESSRAHSRVRECVASLMKRKGWLRTTEWAETRNGMSYLSGSFQLSSCLFLFASHRNAIFVPRCKSFYKVFIPILFQSYLEIIFFFSFFCLPSETAWLPLWQIFQSLAFSMNVLYESVTSHFFFHWLKVFAIDSSGGTLSKFIDRIEACEVTYNDYIR